MTIITGNKTDEDLVREYFKKQQEDQSKPKLKRKKKPAVTLDTKVIPQDSFLEFHNVTCYDADDNVTEHYDRLLVMKDIFRDSNGEMKRLTVYNSSFHAESLGMFNPSTALTLNLLVTSFLNKDQDKDLVKFLQQYKDRGDGFGGHRANTLFNYATSEVIHNPSDSDFPRKYRGKNINQIQKRFSLPFEKEGLQKTTLSKGLKVTEINRFVRQYSGLKEPKKLLELAKYYGQTARIWFPNTVENCTDVRTAWLGCNDRFFYLDASSILYFTLAARGVKFSP